jgi:hypothetical protein
LLSTDHRKNRPSEISSRFHQSICASSLKFVSGTITPEHAKTAHSNRMGTGNIMSAVPDHQTVGGQNIVLRQNMGEQFRLMIQPAAWH